MKKSLLVLGLLAFGLAACTPSGEVGTFRLLMQDLPIDMDHVWVTFGEIALCHEDGEWKSYETKDGEGNPLKVDLLALRGENLGTIFDGTVDTGTYSQLRLIVTKATYVALEDETDTEIDLFVPSGEIKVPVMFEVGEGGLAEVVVDFDADKSVHVHPTGQGRYIMRPVVTLVRVVTE